MKQSCPCCCSASEARDPTRSERTGRPRLSAYSHGKDLMDRGALCSCSLVWHGLCRISFVLRLARRKIAFRLALVCDVHRRANDCARGRARRVIVIGFRDLIPPPLLVFSAKTRDHAAHDARHLISGAHKNLADKSKHSRAAAVSSSAEGRPQRKLLHVPLF